MVIIDDDDDQEINRRVEGRVGSPGAANGRSLKQRKCEGNAWDTQWLRIASRACSLKSPSPNVSVPWYSQQTHDQTNNTARPFQVQIPDGRSYFNDALVLLTIIPPLLFSNSLLPGWRHISLYQWSANYSVDFVLQLFNYCLLFICHLVSCIDLLGHLLV